MNLRSITKISLFIIINSIVLFLLTDFLLTYFKLYPKFNAENNITIQSGKKLRVKDTNYHHGFSADHVGIQAWSGYNYKVCTDAHTFKTTCDNPTVSHDKSFDVAFIGDSFTEAIGVEYEKSFVGLFASANANLKIANLGVSSYSPSIYYAKLKKYLDDGYHFKRVFVFIDISDIQDEAKYKLDNGRVVSFQKENEWSQVKHESDYDTLIIDEHYNWLGKRFKMTSVLYALIVHQKVIPHTLKIPARHPRGEWTYDANSDAYGNIGVKGATQKAINVMADLHLLLDKKNIQLSIGTYPWPNQIFSDTLVANKQSEIWKSFCSNRCEFFFDAFPRFALETEKTSKVDVYKKYYIPGDVHFNAQGNHLIFQTIQRIFK